MLKDTAETVGSNATSMSGASELRRIMKQTHFEGQIRKQGICTRSNPTKAKLKQCE